MIVRRCTVVMSCKGEYIMEAGELGLEMYFIISGDVEVVLAQGQVVATLSKGV